MIVVRRKRYPKLVQGKVRNGNLSVGWNAQIMCTSALLLQKIKN
jgi:hypothetical protein